MKKLYIFLGIVFIFISAIIIMPEIYYSSLDLSKFNFKDSDYFSSINIAPTPTSRKIAETSEHSFSFDRNEKNINMLIKSNGATIEKELILSQNENNIYGTIVEHAFIYENEMYYILSQANGFNLTNYIYKTNLNLDYSELVLSSSLYGLIENRNIAVNKNTVYYVTKTGDGYCIASLINNKEHMIFNSKEPIDILCASDSDIYFVSQEAEIYRCDINSGETDRIRFTMPLKIRNKRVLFSNGTFLDNNENLLKINLTIFGDSYDLEGNKALLVLDVNTGKRKLIS